MTTTTVDNVTVDLKTPAPSAGDFLQALAGELEQAGVRYCVLQRGDALEEELATDHDVDIAVPSADAGRLARVVRALWGRGYQPLQLLNHAVNSYAIIFAWLESVPERAPESVPDAAEAAPVKTVMLDIAFEHRQSGLIWRSAEELVAGREKRGRFWVAAPETELAYLLIKKLLKDNWKASRTGRFRILAERLGRTRAERTIAQIFGEQRTRAILEGCLGGAPEQALRPLRRRFLWASRAKHPFRLMRYICEDGLRLGRRWLHPSGLALAISEASVAARLSRQMSPIFASVTVEPAGGGLRAWWAGRRLLAKTGLVIVTGQPGAAPDAPCLLNQLTERFVRRHRRWVTP